MENPNSIKALEQFDTVKVLKWFEENGGNEYLGSIDKINSLAWLANIEKREVEVFEIKEHTFKRIEVLSFSEFVKREFIGIELKGKSK